MRFLGHFDYTFADRLGAGFLPFKSEKHAVLGFRLRHGRALGIQGVAGIAVKYCAADLISSSVIILAKRVMRPVLAFLGSDVFLAPLRKSNICCTKYSYVRPVMLACQPLPWQSAGRDRVGRARTPDARGQGISRGARSRDRTQSRPQATEGNLSQRSLLGLPPTLSNYCTAANSRTETPGALRPARLRLSGNPTVCYGLRVPSGESRLSLSYGASMRCVACVKLASVQQAQSHPKL